MCTHFVCVRVLERDRQSVCVRERVCACARERECVCVRVREREEGEEMVSENDYASPLNKLTHENA